MRPRSKKSAKQKGGKTGLADASAQALRGACNAPLDPQARPIWEVLVELGASVPPEEWTKVPNGAAKNLDHYLYGHPKRP